MLLEPPGPDVPAPAGSLAALGPLRLTAAVAAATLALTSTGDLVVLAGLLIVTLARPLPAAAVALAVIAVATRWSTTSLAALAGAQSVLGLGGWVGTDRAAAAAWFAAAAFVLATPAPHRSSDTGRRWPVPSGALLALATGSAAAIVVAGPSGADRLGTRLLGLGAAVALALLVVALPAARARHAVAVAAGAAAAVLVTT